MKIAIQASDLDHKRIDGTRVYILNVLKHMGGLSAEDDFAIYHRKNFNQQLVPPTFANYTIKKIPFPLLWTQTRFAGALFADKPEKLWMPMHSVPLVHPKNTQTTVTIHDLAFKIFPEYFPRIALRKINFLTDLAVWRADKIIAISEAAKKDLLHFYPRLREERVSVVHHGFDYELYTTENIDHHEEGTLLQSYTLERGNYLLYTGAIQPRKNISVLVKAFEDIKRSHPSLKLVIAGDKGWMYRKTLEAIQKSKYRKDIFVTGVIDFENLAVLYRNALAFVFPSLYEGFGIPVLEAFAAGTPVVCARNSSLPEVGGRAALYFDGPSSPDLSEKLKTLLSDDALREELVAKGRKRAQQFSWEKCAQQTLNVIKK